MVSANKNPLGAEEAWALLRQGKRVVIAKGKHIIEFAPADANREALLGQAIGRSGKLRAPTLRIGDTWHVGFNAEMYNHLGRDEEK